MFLKRCLSGGAAMLLIFSFSFISGAGADGWLYTHTASYYALGASEDEPGEETDENSEDAQDKDIEETGSIAASGILRLDGTTADFGSEFRYNGVIYEDFYGLQADCEGALAVGGDLTMGTEGSWQSFQIGSSAELKDDAIGEIYDQDDPYPALLLGGGFSLHNYSMVYGNVVMGKAQEDAYNALPQDVSGSLWVGGGVYFYEEAVIQQFFTNSKSNMSSLSALMKNSSKLTISPDELKGWKYGDDNKTDILAQGKQSYQGKSVAVISIDSGSSGITIGEVKFPAELADYDLLVINLLADDITFTGGSLYYGGAQMDTGAPSHAAGNAPVKELAHKIIWNCPDASSVYVTAYGVIGTVMAADAEFSSDGGSLNGRLIARTLTQRGGFELHNLTIEEPKREYFEDDEPTGSVKLVKHDTEGEKETLPGAVFRLEYLDGEVWTVHTDSLTTDGSGEITVRDLKYGDYRFYEVQAPNGYDLPVERYTAFTIDDDCGVREIHVLTVANTQSNPNSPKGSVKLIKHADGSEDDTLEGAVFQLEYEDPAAGGWIVHTEGLTTNSSGEITVWNLEFGNYRFYEVQAPNGYDLPGDRYSYFTVDDSCVDQAFLLTVSNKKSDTGEPEEPKGSVRLVKHETGNAAVTLEGAVFRLEYLDGEAWTVHSESLTTDGSGVIHLSGLAYGEYRFYEVQAPTGYDLPGDRYTAFSINDDSGVEQTLSLRAANQKTDTGVPNEPRGSVQLVKHETGSTAVTLPGAVFDLEIQNGAAWELHTGNLTVGENGTLRIDGLLYGRYRLKETKAPAGYQLPGSPYTEFTVDEENGGTATLIKYIANDKTVEETPTGSLLLRKHEQGDDSVTLAGAVFTLERLEGGSWEPVGGNLTTDALGEARVSGLAYGHYRLTEITAPAGYRIGSRTATEFIIDEEHGGGKTLELSAANEKIPGSTTTPSQPGRPDKDRPVRERPDQDAAAPGAGEQDGGSPGTEEENSHPLTGAASAARTGGAVALCALAAALLRWKAKDERD